MLLRAGSGNKALNLVSSVPPNGSLAARFSEPEPLFPL